MTQPIIQVENFGKRYRLSHQKRGVGEYRSLGETVSQLGRNILGRLRHPLAGTDETVEDFWALKDVNFEIAPGDRVGIIGRNGAGKSTLLKLLCRITEPSTGKAVLRGRVASLLEVGTGFHPELTGRENIYLNGSILGMKHAEIKRKFDEIVDFSGVEKFLDTPVKRYSSGMYVRLAFAVAAHLEPEILLIDEVLAVGDAEFQKKCLGKMEDISRNSGRTILFVSHNMAAVKNLCNRGILLDKGTIWAADDNINRLIDRYDQDYLRRTTVPPVAERKDRRGDGSVKITDFYLEKAASDFSVCQDDPLTFVIGYQAAAAVNRPRLLLSVNKPGMSILYLDSNTIDAFPGTLPSRGTIRISLSRDFVLTAGDYFINLAILQSGMMADYIQDMYFFTVVEGMRYANGRAPMDKGICDVTQHWEVL